MLLLRRPSMVGKEHRKDPKVKIKGGGMNAATTLFDW